MIPDTQVKPGVPLDNLDWIGNFIVDNYHNKPNVKIIHIGDHWDMPSLSMYDKGTKKMEGRRHQDDLDVGNEGFLRLNQPLLDHNKKLKLQKKAPWNPQREFFEGNHEDRINRAINFNPQLEGMLSMDRLNIEELGWNRNKFLQVKNIDGIRYAHYFYNPMTGKPFGGQNIELRIKSIGHSFSMGHQQTLMYGLRFTSDGTSQHGLVAGACYLHDEDYKGPQGNAHWRGIIVKHQVRDGSYDPMFVSLDYLCRRYEGCSLEHFMKVKYPNL
jgi:hypothetical protein